MPVFSNESLEALRSKVDLYEVISPYVNCKNAGGSYKALCPFHKEKSPSFTIQRGDSHYHCFGCGAHGDAIAFLMNYLKLSFSEAVEVLAEKFGIVLEYSKGDGRKGIDYAPIKNALNVVTDFFHFHLLHTDEGHSAMEYLFKRGIDLEFVKRFKIGLSPKDEQFSMSVFRGKKLNEVDLQSAGLTTRTQSGRVRPFFSNRIMFPIMDMMHNTIGFSARKMHEETFGGKYINTSKTPLFNKSKVLFGLNYCRSTIAKEGKAIVVEGQIDALRLIQEGLEFTVAGQGTAFGEGHVDTLRKIGVKHAYIAFDGDSAGREAAIKVGQLFQIEGIEVSVVLIPPGLDPDTLLRSKGIEVFKELLENPMKFIPFALRVFATKMDSKSPAGKNQIAKELSNLVNQWKHPIMVHEGMKLLAKELKVPEKIVAKDFRGVVSRTPIKQEVNSDRVLELDLLRWLILIGRKENDIWVLALNNLGVDEFVVPECKRVYEKLLEIHKTDSPLDLLTVGQYLEEGDEKMIPQMLEKKVNVERALIGMQETILRILERNWMNKREVIKTKIQSGDCSEDEAIKLAADFDALKSCRPIVKLNNECETMSEGAK